MIFLSSYVYKTVIENNDCNLIIIRRFPEKNIDKYRKPTIIECKDLKN